MAEFKICSICYDSNFVNGATFISSRLSNKMKLGLSVCTKCYQNHMDNIQFKKDYLNRKIDLNSIYNTKIEDEDY